MYQPHLGQLNGFVADLLAWVGAWGILTQLKDLPGDTCLGLSPKIHTNSVLSPYPLVPHSIPVSSFSHYFILQI